MKKFKSEDGFITVLVLASVLFMIAFLISSYILASNKVQAQKEIVAQTKEIYENHPDIEDIYNSYFSNQSEVVPIYTVEQLLAIGSGEQFTINGKIYNFSNDASYMLMNDLTFDADNFQNVLGEGKNWTPIGFTNIAFEGNNSKITVTKLDDSVVEYNRSNKYMNTLPDEYQQVEYIQGTGSQYINTGIYLTNEDEIIAEIELNNLNLNRGIAGARTGVNSKNNTITFQSPMIASGATGLTLDFNDSIYNNYRLGSNSVQTGVKYIVTNSNDKREISNINLNTTICNDTFVTDYPCYIFYTAGSLFSNDVYKFIGKVYRFEIKCKFYGIPCYRKSDGEIGLYDLINCVFCTNVGDGKFECEKSLDLPEEYQQVEYIKGTGTQYIDTGIYLTSEDKIKIDCTLTSVDSNVEMIMGSREGYSSKNIEISRQPSGYGLCCDFNNSSGNTYRYKMTNYIAENRYTIFNNKTSRGIENLSSSTVACSDVFTCTTTCYIGFASGDLPSTTATGFKGRIYSAEIEGKWKGIPCYRKSDGEIGMYDIVNNVFYTNAGEGTFEKGDIIT